MEALPPPMKKPKNPPFTPDQWETDDVCFVTTSDNDHDVSRVYANREIVSSKSEFFAALLRFHENERKVYIIILIRNEWTKNSFSRKEKFKK